MSKVLGWVGGVITVVYLAGWGFLVYHRTDKLIGMELNNIGDFLGGSFGPLAFLWLVLGFFQQGIELRINSGALKLQAAEVKAAADHASGLLDVARKEHELELQKVQQEVARQEAEREAARRAQEEAGERKRERAEAARVRKIQPDFSFYPAHRRSDDCLVPMINNGHSCTNLHIELAPASTFNMKPVDVSRVQSKQTVELFFNMGAVGADHARMKLSYVDTDGSIHIRHLVARSTGDMMLIEEDPELSSRDT
jgi:hypothetical protein